MSTWLIVVITVAALAIVAFVAYAAIRAQRRRMLQDRFGNEYDRTVADASNRRTGERELTDRLQRRDELDIQPLDPMSAQRYRDQWRLIQQQFVDAPAESVAQAHALVETAMAERGYPTDDRDERVAMLSVDHADVLDRYRAGTETESRWRDSGTTNTEELRLAMQHYRAVFASIVGVDNAYPTDPTEDAGTTTSRAATATRGTPAGPVG